MGDGYGPGRRKADRISRHGPIKTEFSADGKRLLIVFGGDNDIVQVWDVDTGLAIGTAISYVDLIPLATTPPARSS